MSDEAPRPLRPDPWATTQPREALRDTNAGRIMSLTPGAAHRQVGSASVPYFGNMVDFCGHDEGYTPTVRFTGQKALVLRSKTRHVHGGSGGVCEPIGHARQVRAEGSPLTRDGDLFYMDNRKTTGEASFVRDTARYAAPSDDDPFPGSLRLVRSGPGDAPRVMSDAVPDPSYARPGARLAYDDPTGRFTTQAAPRSTTPQLERTGPFGQPPTGAAGRLLPLIGLAPGAIEGAGRAYEFGNALRQQDAGPNDVIGDGIATTLEGQVAPGTPQFPAVAASRGLPPYGGTEANIRRANDMLSLKAGEPLDFRTMDPDQPEALLRQPWASADQVRENDKKLKQQKKQAEIMPVPGDNARISEDKRERRCKVGPYSEMQNYCPAYGMQAHHIMPDYTLRYGTRGESEKGINRIPNRDLPTYWSGPSICLDGNASEDTEHGEAHGADAAIEKLGQKPGTPLGTAPFDDVAEVSVESVLGVRLECTREVTSAMATNFGSISPRQLVRTTWPTTDQAIGPLSRGDLATLH